MSNPHALCYSQSELLWITSHFPGGLGGKESTCNAGDLGLIPGLGGSPREKNGNPLQYSYLETHGQRSLASYSPWDHEESDTTEQLTAHFTSHL